MKTLVIINGITGAVGTACLAEFSRVSEVTIFGLSRKGEHFSVFTKNGLLPNKTLICSIGDITSKNDCVSFTKSINLSLYEKIIYIHAVGVYPFEIDSHGNIKVSHDEDGDGIDDRVVKLSYDAFFAMSNSLKETDKKIHALILGGLSDKHRPAVHKSWWTVMEKVKNHMSENISETKNIDFFVLDISSIICPHELLTRPFVFQNTNANPRFWLMPHEVAEEIVKLTLPESKERFTEKDLFYKSDYYENNYFEGEKFTQRKREELGIETPEK